MNNEWKGILMQGKHLILTLWKQIQNIYCFAAGLGKETDTKASAKLT